MLVSHLHKAIFIRNPRCASTSIAEALSSLDFQNIWDLEEGRQQNWHSVDLLPLPYAKYYRFTTCRNPYSRLVSMWLFGVTHNGYAHSFSHYLNKINPKHEYFGLQVKYASVADAVFPVEQLNDTLCLPFGTIHIPRLNAIEHKAISEYYTPQLMYTAYIKYLWDFMSLGYRHDVFS